MPQATVTVDLEKPIGTVSPRLYGHFAEHLGRCCYDGIWVGRDSEIPNDGGFRQDAVDALKGDAHAPPALARRLLRRPLPLARRHRARAPGAARA